MKKDYPNGTIIRSLAFGNRGVIQKSVWDTSRVLTYEVFFDDGHTMQVPWDELAPEDHPWHEQMKKWREQGIAEGHNSIYIAIDETNQKYKAFFGDSMKGYQAAKKNNPKLKFKYFWRLRE